MQLVAIIFTLSTFSFGPVDAGAVDEEPAGLVEVAEDEVLSSVPVISTLWPTCGLSLLSSASSR